MFLVWSSIEENLLPSLCLFDDYLGLGIGLTTCWAVGNYGYRLDPKVYLIDRLPISVSWFEVALVAGITMVISAVATLIPSAKASGLRPVEGLRYD